MSDRFSFFKDLLEKLRPNNFDDSEALVTAKKVPQTKVDSSGKKRVVISDDSEVVDKNLREILQTMGLLVFGYVVLPFAAKKVDADFVGSQFLGWPLLQSSSCCCY